MREAVALRRVKHPNVVGFRQVFVRTGWLCLVMDFADGGDLCAAVKERAKLDSPFEESAVLECFAQIADAVNFVHSVKMVHRDIKSRNIFLCRTGRALLGDFGLVRLLENTLELARTRVGTPYYLSPEIIQRRCWGQCCDLHAGAHGGTHVQNRTDTRTSHLNGRPSRAAGPLALTPSVAQAGAHRDARPHAKHGHHTTKISSFAALLPCFFVCVLSLGPTFLPRRAFPW